MIRAGFLAAALLAASVLAAQEPNPCCCAADDTAPHKTEERPKPNQSADRGTVRGTVVMDDNPLPGVTITLKQGSAELTEVSDVNGRFEFFNVPPGERYEVCPELTGLKARPKKHVAIVAGKTTTIAFQMKIDESQMVCIDCGPALPVMPDGPSFVITREMMDTLPIH